MLGKIQKFMRYRPATLALSALCAFGVVSGCAVVLGFEETTRRTDDGEGGTTEGGPDGDANLPPDSGPSRLTTKPASPVVRRGATADVVVEIARGSDVTGTVTAVLSDLPVGVTATTAMLAPTASTATLKLTAAANATLGLKTIKLTAEGSALPAADIPLLVADPPGALDITFDADGFVADNTRGNGSTFFAVAVQTDQRIIAAGTAGPVGGPLAGWMVRRYTATGAPDAAFNTASAVGIPADGELRAIAFDATGRIVCAGSSGNNPQLTVIRLSSTGAIDKTFGAPTGIVRIANEGGAGATAVGLGITVQADGKVIVVGERRPLVGAETGTITRFNDNGVRDPGFNNGTTVAVPGTRFVGASADVGGVFVGGSTIGGAPSYVVTRRTAAGAIDPTFGAAGTAVFGATFRAGGFARLMDGSFALVGDIQAGPEGYSAGVADAMGVAAFARTYGNAAGASFFGVALQADNRIVVAGHTAVANGEARVERLLPGGDPDTSFGTGGIATIENTVPNALEVTLFGAAVQTDGRILVAGNRSGAGAAAAPGATIYRLFP